MSAIKCPMCSSNLLTPDRIERMLAKQEEQLVSGKSQDCTGELDINPVSLLRKVVSSVINHGRQDILWEFPELLEFLGSRIPAPEEVEHLHGIDQRMFEAKAKWPNLIREDGTC
ncbi:hypothetical protein FHT87_005207 [Rhizobium sp. BK316]|uniref:hypothetical protein n=1 Tax=Rhizobium sp. BK316 TaxID=2587053 RepID=UPI00160D42D8|nr:hypothetical protein [Rhizobium sp. BK316]MBB3411254.1 hypothetical protein [Rhizobium sp. BK316]